MTMARSRAAAFAVAVLAVLGCPGPTPSPPPPPPPAGGLVTLDILRRDATGALVSVPGIPVHRNDAATGAFVETKTTDATGRVDFGVQPGPVTLSIVRPPPAGGGTTWIYTLLGMPAGGANLRLDRLPGEPATPLATVEVALSPALSSLERASAWLPTGVQGHARPLATSIPGVVIGDHDVQADGKVTLLTEVDDDEMGTEVGCRLSADQAVTSATTALPPATSVPPETLTVQGSLGLDRIVVVRKGVASALRPRPTCATAFTDADGFSLQGSLGFVTADVQRPSYLLERRASQKRGALWQPGPGLSTANPVTLPSADVTIEALDHASGTIHFTLKGAEVGALTGARASVIWGTNAWTLLGGMAVTPATCDGTSSNPDCTIAVKLPAVPGVVLPPTEVDGLQIAVEALAPAGLTTASRFWTELRAQGDADAVLVRGYRSAYRSLALSRIDYAVDVGPYVQPGWLPYGRVTGSGGIDCGPLAQGTLCFTSLPGGSTVTLSATPNNGAEFVQWVGVGCGSATTSTASFTLTGDTSCMPRFQPLGGGSYPLTVGVLPTGAGLIWSDDGFISCGYDGNFFSHPDCGPFNYGSGTLLTLHGAPSDNLNAYDVAWGGDCTGNGPNISVLMDKARNCTLTFTIRP